MQSKSLSIETFNPKSTVNTNKEIADALPEYAVFYKFSQLTNVSSSSWNL